MKIRYGFVTNSSSVSFCVVGKFFFSIEEVVRCLTESGKDEAINQIGNDEWELETLANEAGLDFHSDESGDSYYIGLDIESIRDNETMGEFKRRASEALHKFGLSNRLTNLIKSEISIHTEGYYNG